MRKDITLNSTINRGFTETLWVQFDIFLPQIDDTYYFDAFIDYREFMRLMEVHVKGLTKNNIRFSYSSG